MVKEMKPFIPEVIIWGYIIALFQQQKAATWKKDVNKEGRLDRRLLRTSALTPGSMCLHGHVSREETDCPER